MIKAQHKTLLAFLLIVIFPLSLWSSFTGWNSFVVTFNKNLYGNGRKIWQIASYDERWTYFANDNGLLQFDGNVWSLYPLRNQSPLRAVLPSSNMQRIYVGGINEYGYFEPGDDGNLIYHCLSDTLDGDYRFLGNIWGIHESDNIIYFCGDSRVIKYWNGQFSIIEVGTKIDCSNVVNGTLYVGTENGVNVLVGNKFFPLQGADGLMRNRIRGIESYKDGILVATAYDGLFYCDGHGMSRFETGIEDYMRENEIFCMAKQGARIALGTIHQGLLVLDTETMAVQYYNEYNKLSNNTVLSLAFDATGNLWAGLEGSIDYICLNLPFTNLYSYPYSYGAGYTVAVENGNLYLGTNRGLYYTSYPVRMNGERLDIFPIPNSSGQVWSLCRIKDELLCLHDRGVFVVQGANVKRILEIDGAWTCQPVMNHDNLIYIGVYNGIYVAEKVGNDWKLKGKIIGLDESCRVFEQESEKIIWVFNNKTVFRFELGDDLLHVINRKAYGVEDGFPAGSNNYVTKVQNKIFFTTQHGVYHYDPQTDRMVPSSDINSLLNGPSPYLCLREYNNHLISLNEHEICLANLHTYKRAANTRIIPIHQSLVGLIPDFGNVYPLSDSLMIIPSEEGFALLQIPNQKTKGSAPRSVFIRNMYLSYPKDSLVYTANFQNKKIKPVIDYSYNSVRIDYSTSNFLWADDVRFQYRLNQGEWSNYTTMCTKEYSNLSEGEYMFEVKAVFSDGSAMTDTIDFVIRAPWYRSVWAYSCYLLLICLFLYLIYRWEELRMLREKQQAVVEKDKKMKEMAKEYEEERARQEKQIMLLEKETLEHDLQHKSQEMANLMINFVRKNEMLNDIKAEIAKVIASLKGESAREGKKQLLLISSKIDANIQSDEVLKRIEEQFDLIHNNFMKRLHAKHPTLSNNERMMCAYLKMNLSTKEIAPLLNISVRGVETIRYRLRKKFGLEREDSLVDYLNNQL